MVPFTQTLQLAALGMFLTGLFAAPALAQGEKLVPPNRMQLMDQRGNRWDFTSQGSVGDGTNDCFDNGAVLRVDGVPVAFSRPMMTADGTEYVFSTRHRSLTVTRRVRLDAEAGALRYLEIFENPGNAPQTVVAAIHTDLGNDAQRVITAQDQMLAGGLGKDDGAFVAVQTDGSRPSVVFVVADPKSKNKPDIRRSGNRSYDIVYTAEVPAKGSVAFVHYLAQRPNGSGKEAQDLLARYYKRGRLTDPNLPKAYHNAIANFSFRASSDEAGADSMPPLLGPLTELAESAGLSREKADSLAIDTESKLVGTISGEDFEIQTTRGKTRIAFADVAGIAGGAGVQRPIRVFLRNGEILSGEITGGNFAMKADSGLSLEVDLASIHLFTLRAAEADGVAPADAVLLLTTQAGDRLALGGTSQEPLEVATAWGTARISLAELRSLTSAREPFPSHRLVLSDRSQFSVMMRGGEWAAPSVRFGILKIFPQEIRDLQRIAPTAPDTADSATNAPAQYCELIGESRLTGVIDLPSLNLAAESTLTPVDPKHIREIETEKGEGADPIFTIKLIGGQELKGSLAETFLSIRNGSRVWRVPVAHFVAFRTEAQKDEPEEEKSREKKGPSGTPPGRAINEVPANPAPVNIPGLCANLPTLR